MTDRVVVLVDMDCFYCQVEERDDPSLVGKPSAVVQYKAWKGGGIIAVNYEARAFGVTRNMRGDDAREKCPEIRLVRVPEVRGKADLTKYRDAGKEVIQVLLQFGGIVERASIDEAYLDMTKVVDEKLQEMEVTSDLLPNTFVVGHEDDREDGLSEWIESLKTDEVNSDNLRLAIGASIVEKMRAAVFEQTGFRCSAGIAHNKMLSKFACGMHKPNKQTILPHDKVSGLFTKLKIGKLRGLGGKLGDTVVEALQCETVEDLSKLSLKQIRKHFDEKTSQWLFDLAKGFDNEPVRERDLPKSIGCSKNFRGPEILDTKEKVEHWVGQLAEEVSERLNKDRTANHRVARGLHVGISPENQGYVSRAGPLHSYDSLKLARQAMTLIAKFNEAASELGQWRPKLKNISISASKFEEDAAPTKSIQNFFTKKLNAEPAMKTCPDSIEAAPSEVTSDIPSKEIREEIVDTTSSTSVQKTLVSSIPASFTSPSASTSSEIDSNSCVNNGGFDVADLVPNLENFDPSILEDLPLQLRKEVEEHVKRLREMAEVDQANENDSEAAMETCPKCGKEISPFDLPEHLDFHYAQEVQNELRSEGQEEVRKGPIASTVAKKRKRENKNEESKKQRNITNFFLKK